MAELDEVSQKIGELGEQVEHLKDAVDENSAKVDRLCGRFDDVELMEEEELDQMETMVSRHEWYWRGFFSFIAMVGFFISLGWQHISKLWR